MWVVNCWLEGKNRRILSQQYLKLFGKVVNNFFDKWLKIIDKFMKMCSWNFLKQEVHGRGLGSIEKSGTVYCERFD